MPSTEFTVLTKQCWVGDIEPQKGGVSHVAGQVLG